MNNPPMSSGKGTTRTFEFGMTHVVKPKGNHQATVVWLHGLGDKGSRCLTYWYRHLLEHSLSGIGNDICRKRLREITKGRGGDAVTAESNANSFMLKSQLNRVAYYEQS